ncbi:MAG: ABC transporter substrate-binding protein [Chloroflexota bacterium]
MRHTLVMLCLLALITLPAAAQDQDDDQLETPIVVTDATGQTVTITDLSRIVTIGGPVTEIVFELGMGDNIIAVDESSIYPPAAEELPHIGYIRFLSAEPILSYNPSLIITTTDAGPVETLEQLSTAGATVLVAPAEDTLEGAEDKIRVVAAGIGRAEEGEALIAEMRTDIERAQALTDTIEARPRVLFVFAGSNIALGVLGRDSGGNEMLELARVENAVTQAQSYIPLSAEAIVNAAPDIILTTTLSIQRVGGYEAFLALPGIALTPAAQNGRIVYEGMDDLYLLGFTPRLGEAILDLTYLLHEDLPRSAAVVTRLNAELQLFENALEAADLEITLNSGGPYTVFAPFDGAFDADRQLPGDPATYIVEGRYSLDDLSALDGQSLETLAGTTIDITLDESGVVVLNGSARISGADQPGENGIVHTLDSFLPPVDEAEAAAR